MSCYFGVGQLNKNLYILLLAVLFQLLSEFIYGLYYTEYTENNKKKSLYNYESILKGHKLLQSIMRFYGITILSFVYYKYENSDSFKSKKSKFKLKLIHNKGGPNNIKCKYIFLVSFFGFLFGFLELLAQFHKLVAQTNTGYWPFEILFTAIFTTKIFKTNLYTHQIFSITFIVCLCSLMQTIYTIESYNKKPFELKRLYYVPLYFLIMLIRSYVNTKIKWLMDIRYISISKMLLIYGSFGFFTSLIIYILTSIFPCFISETFENFSSPIESINFRKFMLEIFLIIAYMCLNFFNIIYYMLTLKTFSPIYVLINNSLYNIILHIILIIYKLFNGKMDLKSNADIRIFIYYEVINIFAIFGYLIYVELIELKFCGCDYNLKKNIIKRSRIDTILVDETDEEIGKIKVYSELSNSLGLFD